MRAGNMVRPGIISGRGQAPLPPMSIPAPCAWPTIGSVPVAPSRYSCKSGGDMRALGEVARRSSRPSHSGASARASAVTRIKNLFRLTSPTLRVPFVTGPRLTIWSKRGVASHAMMWL